jgi:hypothetical protein
MFLGMGSQYQYDKGLLLEIENQRDTVLTFMGTTILGDTSKVGALLQQWSAESIHDVVVGSWGGHNLNWKVDAAVMVSMFEGLYSTREQGYSITLSIGLTNCPIHTNGPSDRRRSMYTKD